MICAAPTTRLRIFLVIDIVSDTMLSEPLSAEELPITMGRLRVKSEMKISYCTVRKTLRGLDHVMSLPHSPELSCPTLCPGRGLDLCSRGCAQHLSGPAPARARSPCLIGSTQAGSSQGQGLC